ncbi:MAG: polyprenol monophosphomannose synthase [Chloroflexota bacterium]|nr:MAG: polyprenol monophosphomannose synthase [Chloroflexota bacterium]
MNDTIDQNITLIIPTYNEAENLPKLVSVLFNQPIPDLHVLVVDDNSADGTGEIARRLAEERPGKVSVLHRPGKMGLGSAYRQGFRLALDAGAQVVAQMDADFSHPPEKVVEILAALDSCDVAIGSRYVPGGSVDQNWPRWRKGLSSFGNFYARSILGLPLRDVTGGFRFWRREALEAIPLERVRSSGYAFMVEMAYLASLVGCCFVEVPIYFADRRWGKSKMSFRIQLEAALRVWQILFAYRDLAGGRRKPVSG